MGFLIFIISITCLLFFISRVKEGHVILIFANIGAGKTTLLARYAKKEQHKINKGKSNFDIIISNTPISGCIYVPNIRKFLQQYTPERTLILIDEAGLVYNNRKMKISDEEIEYFKMIRHYDSKVVLVSQGYDDVDITLRRIYTNMYLLNRFVGVSLIKPIRKSVDIDKETSQIIDAYAFRILFSWGLLKRSNYFDMFDTKWKPEGKKHPIYEEFQLIPFNEKKKNIIQLISNSLMKNTHRA